MNKKKKYISPECASYEIAPIYPIALSESLPKGDDDDEEYYGPLGMVITHQCNDNNSLA